MDLDKFKQNGKFLMLAFDHRGSFKKLMSPQNPDAITDQEVIQLKTEIINAVVDQMSGILIDEQYGLEAYPQHQKPFLLPVERSGYTDQQGERITELEFKVSDLIKMGASGAKILLYFNPFIPSASQQLATAKHVLDECKQNNFPFFLELVMYEVDDNNLEETREKLLLNSVKMFINSGVVPDVFKLEYPGSQEGCQQITELLGDIPWILLTRGDTFDIFTDELRQAIQVGCQGFLAGRALWQEVCAMNDLQKEEFLKTTLPNRFKEISQICLTSVR